MIDAALAPTCTETGLTEGAHCSVCGQVLKAQGVIPALGHTVVIDAALAPTCTETGLTEGAHCSVCGQVLKAQEVIPALGHTVVIDAALAPTCTETGLTEGAHCSVCGQVLKAQEAIPAQPTMQKSPSIDHRLYQLTSMPAAEWPIGRILAFGASIKDYQGIIEESDEYDGAIASHLRMNDDYLETYQWMTTLDDQAWEKAYSLCAAIHDVSKTQREGVLIANWKAKGFSDEQITKTLSLSNTDMRHKLNEYTNAVTDVFRNHSDALGFLYEKGYSDRPTAEVFFGQKTLLRMEKCCSMEKIHSLRNKGRKVIGLQATLKEEASNKRTRVLDQWEHLQKYLEDQFDTQPLLGSIELDDREYDLLIQFMQRHYKFVNLNNSNSIHLSNNKAMCVGLVQIALRCKGTAYWPIVAETLNTQQTANMRESLGLLFLQTMKHCKKATYTTSEYVASIKLHAFVINEYIPRLFEFLFAYYELDLGRNMEFANVEELRLLMISGGYFSRKQMVLQQTIDALKLIPEVSLARFKTYLHWIDEAFWHQGWLPEQEDRFGRAFKEWCQSKPEFTGEWQSNGRNWKKGKRMFSQPGLSLDLGTGKISMILPVQRLPFDNEGQTTWHVSAGDHHLFTVPCELIESITSLRTQEKKNEFPLQYILDEIRADFLCDDRIIRTYRIARDCIRIFNAQGAMVSGKRIPAGEVFFLSRAEDTVETESEGMTQRIGPWMMKTVVLQNGELVVFPDESLAIVGSDVSEGMIGGHPVAGVQMAVETDNTHVPVYAEFPSFLLKVTEDQFEKTRIQINGVFMGTQNLKYRCLTLNERTAEKGYLVSLPSPDEMVSLCHIRFDVPNDYHTREWSFCYWKDFHYAFDNGSQGLPYWDVPRGSIRLDTPVIFSGEGIKKDPASNEYGFEIDPVSCKLDLSFRTGQAEGTLRFDVPAVAWTNEERHWTASPLGDVWHSEFPDAMDIHAPSEEVSFYIDKDGMSNGQSVSFHKLGEEDTVHCDLLALKQWFTRDKLIHNVYLNIMGKSFLFANVYCRSYMVSGRLEADYINHTLHGAFDIIGKGSYVATVLHGEKEVLSQIPISEGSFDTNTSLKSGTYTAVVYEEVSDEFGFETIYDEIGRHDVKVLNPSDLAGATFFVRQVDTVDELLRDLPVLYQKCQVTLDEKAIEGFEYTGFLKDCSASVPYSYPVLVSFPDPKAIDHCQILFDDDGEWQPLLYDFNRKRLVREEKKDIPFMERYRRYVALVPEDTYAITYDVTDNK